MDAKDVRIFCELAFRETGVREGPDSPPSSKEIGRLLGLDEKTVRSRVRKMEDSGFIKYYQATPSLPLLGLRSLGIYRFEAMNIVTKQRLLEYLRSFPHVVEAFDFLGPVVSVSLSGTEKSEIKDAVRTIAGMFELTSLGLGERTLRETQSKLDGLDWQIIRRLRYDARCPAKNLAEALSITRRMAEYRMAKIEEAGAVLTRAVIDTRKQEGLVFYELEVSLEPSKQLSVERDLRTVSGETLWSMSSPRPGAILVNLFGFGLGEPEESLLKTLKVDGVRACTLFVLKEMIEPDRPNWIDKMIDLQISEG